LVCREFYTGVCFFFSSRRRHTRSKRDWSSDVCSSDLGGMEAIITAYSLREGKVHPTINLINPAPECDLNYVPNGAEEADLKYAVSNSLGFGGHNASLVFKKYEE